MNVDLVGVIFIIFAFIVIVLWLRIMQVEQQVIDATSKIDNLELDNLMKCLFQTDAQRFDLMLRKKIEHIINELNEVKK